MTQTQQKKILTRKEFEEERILFAKKMGADTDLQGQALDVLLRADRYNWIHQTNWFGEPILQFPQDLFSFQEIFFKTRPEYLIEVGVAWAGSLLFYSTMLPYLGGKKIIGIDIFIPDDLKARIQAHRELAERIILIEASSVDPSTIDRIRSIVGDSRKCFVHLDSDHTHAHVYQELELYQQFVGKDQYMICGDTIVEKLPVQTHRPRPWGPGNNPMTALQEFLGKNKRFETDRSYQNKYLYTCHPEGYLRCIAD